MPQSIQLSQIIPFFGMATSIVFNGLNQPQHIINAQTQQAEIHILPWVIQIVFGLAYLIYSQNAGDVFLFVQAIPYLMAGISQTLHWHPFYRKAIRKFHEYLLFFSMGVLYIVTSGTTIYFGAGTQIGIIASGVMTVLFATLTVLTMSYEKWRQIQNSRPRVMELIVAGVGLANGGFWTAYGFWGISDWVVCASAILWLTYTLIHGLLILYGMFYNGGLESNPEDDEDEDPDLIVDRFNRAPTIASQRGYPPMANNQSPDMGYSSGRQSMQLDDGGFISDNTRARRSMRPDGQPGPDFEVQYSPTERHHYN